MHLFEVLEALLEEVEVGGNILLKRVAARERVAIGVYGHIERLGVRSELVALQPTPLGANGAQCALLSAVVGDLDGI